MQTRFTKDTMRKLLLILLLVGAFPMCALAQPSRVAVERVLPGSSTGTLSATGSVTLPMGGYAGFSIQLVVSGSNTTTFEASTDGTNYQAISMTPTNSTTTVTTATASGIWTGAGNFATVRARVSTYSSGAVTATIVSGMGGGSGGGGGGGGGGGAVTVADGADVTQGAQADAKSTATDTTPVSAMSVLKQISASVQAPPSQAVTNAGTFSTQAAGTKTNNNAAPGATNVGALTGLANTAAPTYTDGNLVAPSTDLKGQVRVLIGKTDGTANSLAQDATKSSTFSATGPQILCASVSADPAAETTGNATQIICDLSGKVVTSPYALSDLFVSGTTSAMTGTTSTSLVAAPASGLRNYITQLTCVNSHATVGTFVTVQDGSGGTALYTLAAAAVFGGSSVTFPVPLKQPTTATALYVADVTTGANVICSASGYKGR